MAFVDNTFGGPEHEIFKSLYNKLQTLTGAKDPIHTTARKVQGEVRYLWNTPPGEESSRMMAKERLLKEHVFQQNEKIREPREVAGIIYREMMKQVYTLDKKIPGIVALVQTPIQYGGETISYEQVIYWNIMRTRTEQYRTKAEKDNFSSIVRFVEAHPPTEEEIHIIVRAIMENPLGTTEHILTKHFEEIVSLKRAHQEKSKSL
jgi:hypothetical protein